MKRNPRKTTGRAAWLSAVTALVLAGAAWRAPAQTDPPAPAGAPAAPAPTSTPPPPPSLAQFVPADVGLFVELQGADDLLVLLADPQAWLTISELAGQSARLEDTQAWSDQVREIINMSPAEAIRALFSQRVALAGESWRRSQDAVVLCEPAKPARELLQQWRVQPLPTAGRTSVYRLPRNVGLAVYDRLLVFGEHATPGMFRRVLRVLEAGDVPRLADDPVYQRLRARVPAEAEGVFFARLQPAVGSSTTTQAASGPATPAATAPAPSTAPQPTATPGPRARGDLPGPLRGSTNVLFGLHREGKLLHLTAVGDAPGEAPPEPAGRLANLVATLPERTLVAWAGHVDYPSLTRAVQRLPERHLVRLLYQLEERFGHIDRVTAALDDTACVAVGVVQPGRRAIEAPAVPAVAVLLGTRDGDAAGEAWGTLLDATLSVYKLLGLKVTPPPPALEPRTLELEGVWAEELDLSAFLPIPPELSPLGEVQLCWALDGDVLILASHWDWLRQILAARHERGPRLAKVLELSRRGVATQRENVFVAQTGPIADLGAEWLRFIERVYPPVMEEDWWRRYQPGGGHVRLGVQVTSDADRRRLRVQSTTPGTPAYSVLQPGDEIVGANHRRFATSQPIAEMITSVMERPRARRLELLIEREGRVQVAALSLPFVDPVQVLGRIVSIGRMLQRLIYADELPDPAGPRGFLTLELRGEVGPLFDFAAIPRAVITPTTQPTTAPATQPSAPAETQPSAPPVSAPTTAPVASPAGPAPPTQPDSPTTQPPVAQPEAAPTTAPAAPAPAPATDAAPAAPPPAPPAPLPESQPATAPVNPG